MATPDKTNNIKQEKTRAKAWSFPVPVGPASDQDLLVLEDTDNGNEYYLQVLDSFRMFGRTYICMASCEPETGAHTEPQLVIMRQLESKDNQQYFQSIRDKKELDKVFNAFYQRMEQGL